MGASSAVGSDVTAFVAMDYSENNFYYINFTVFSQSLCSKLQIKRRRFLVLASSMQFFEKINEFI